MFIARFLSDLSHKGKFCSTDFHVIRRSRNRGNQKSCYPLASACSSSVSPKDLLVCFSNFDNIVGDLKDDR